MKHGFPLLAAGALLPFPLLPEVPKPLPRAEPPAAEPPADPAQALSELMATVGMPLEPHVLKATLKQALDAGHSPAEALEAIQKALAHLGTTTEEAARNLEALAEAHDVIQATARKRAGARVRMEAGRLVYEATGQNRQQRRKEKHARRKPGHLPHGKGKS